MKNYGVKEVAKLSGISVRTLHYYDQIGLLKPSARTDAGYRHYNEEELLRLQQILFYKELDVPLKQISAFLDQPEFNLINALESHRSALISRRKRISSLLATINKTIDHLKQEDIMDKPEMLYEGLPKAVETSYRKEAAKKYGKRTIEQSETDLLKLGREGFRKLNAELRQITNELFLLHSTPPESEKVQHLIAVHYETIRKFWGKSVPENKQLEVYAGLGELYVTDERYTTMEGQPQPMFAQFMQKAMSYFANTHLKKLDS
ncbi:MAG: MerR family transcriptional regulator [Bacteroidota bacterium]